MKYKQLFVYSLIALTVAGVSVAGSWAYAGLATSTINVCVSKIGLVRIIPDGQPLKCMKHEKLLSWNNVGPQGEQGPKGDQGIQGEQGPAGSPSWDESRIAELEARVAALEATDPVDPPTDPEDPGTPADPGLYAEVVSTNTRVIQGDAGANDRSEFTIKFDITAVGAVYHVDKNSVTAIGYHLEDGVGASITDGVIVHTLSTTASTDELSYRIEEGETETFTLNISFDPNTTNVYSAQADFLRFGTQPMGPFDQQLLFTPEEDYETDSVYLNA